MTNELGIRRDMGVAAAFGWRDWSRPRGTSIRDPGFHVGVWTRYFQNTKRDGYPLERDIQL